MYKSLSFIILLLQLSLLVLLQVGSAEAKYYGLDASWVYNESGTDKEDDNNNSFLQRYHVKWLSHVTRAITMDANMNYTRTNGAQGSTTRTSESISPTLDVLLNNDLFLMQINGRVFKDKSSRDYENSDNSSSQDTTVYSWETSLKSNWQNLYWPMLQMLIGQNQYIDSLKGSGVTSKSDWFDFGAQWEIDALQTYYNYSLQNNTDNLNNSSNESETHFGRIDYSRSFHDSRGFFSISQQITDTVTDFTAAVAEGENVNISVGLTSAFAGNDQTPNQGFLPSNPGLIDGNRNTPVFIIELLQKANLAIKADMQQVDTLYVYTGELDPTLENEAGRLSWDLYTSRDGTSWSRDLINVPTVYNRNNFRYEVDVRGAVNIYMKLVVTAWPVSLSVPVTEIEAYRMQTGTGPKVDNTRNYTKYVTDFNVSYAPTAITQASYSMVWKTEESSEGNTRDRLFQTGSLQWFYSKYFTPSLTINDTMETNTRTEDVQFRSYGLSIRSLLLPTLDTTLSITKNESKEDGEVTNSNVAVNLRTMATLYPNLESTLDLNAAFNDLEIEEQSSKSYGVRWVLSSRLRPNLITNLTTAYRVNTVDNSTITSEEDSGGWTGLDFNYRVSDRLSFVLFGKQGFGDKSDEQSLVFRTDFSAFRTAKSEVFLGYRFGATQDGSINNFECNWSWNISPYLTFQSFANYLVTDEQNGWAINVRLTAGF